MLNYSNMACLSIMQSALLGTYLALALSFDAILAVAQGPMLENCEHHACQSLIRVPASSMQVHERRTYLGELSRHEGLHEDTIHDLQLVNVAALELLEAIMLEVAGAALAGKAASAAVEVKIVVLAHVAVHGCAV